jgi:hypothetical protein
MAVRLGNAPLHYQALVATGSSQADAYGITYELSPGFITCAGNDIVGLRLPFPGKGKQYFVVNTGATQMSNLFVYPPVGFQINTLGVNAALVFLPQTATMIVAGGNQWWTCPVVPS